MPEKSVREMNEAERRFYSISAHVFHATIIGSVILGLVAFLVGFGLYAYALAGQYIGESFGLSKSCAAIMDKAADVTPLAEEVMRVYRSIPEEERKNPEDPAYLERFQSAVNAEDHAYVTAILNEFRTAGDVYDVYLAMYDIDTEAIVYIADPDPEGPCPPGYWEETDRKGIEKFLNWDGEGKLYDIDRTDHYGWLCTAGVPLKGADGTIKAFVLTDIRLKDFASGLKSFLWQFFIAVSLANAAFAVLFSLHMKKHLVKPITDITNAAQQYIDDRKNHVESCAHFSNLDIHTGDEIENLSLVMADMEKDAVAYFEELMAVTAEKERIGTELNLATRIQAAVLPSTFPAFPDREEFDIYATMDPAKEVGGDFYDFFMIDDTHLAMVIADVSGKGIPAALFMMTSRTMLKDAALMGLDPAGIMERVNAQLSESNSYFMFVTVWLGILDITTGRLEYSDAGHEQTLLYQNGSWSFLPRKGGVALAAFEPELLALEKEPVFVNKEIILQPGDLIYQYTDGVTEAMTAEREQFGMNRLLAAANEAPSTKPEEFLPYIRGKIDEFVQEAPQFDDITMLALQYRGKK